GEGEPLDPEKLGQVRPLARLAGLRERRLDDAERLVRRAESNQGLRLVAAMSEPDAMAIRTEHLPPLAHQIQPVVRVPQHRLRPTTQVEPEAHDEGEILFVRQTERLPPRAAG